LPGVAKRSECFSRDGFGGFSVFALIHLGRSLLIAVEPGEDMAQ
jgi:hypothetical protein